MGFLRNRLLRRFSIVGRLADVALVASFALRLAQRKGWINDDQLDQFGLSDVTKSGSTMGLGQLALAGAAAARLVRKRRGRR
jgi:hypothetical protein